MDKMNHGAVKCQLKYCVGIGASAGGVEALQELFRNMPLDTGASFIVVQHLSPDSVSMMDKIIFRTIIRITRNNISCNDGRIYYLLSWKNRWRYI